jgi:hypothetical protein
VVEIPLLTVQWCLPVPIGIERANLSIVIVFPSLSVLCSFHFRTPTPVCRNPSPPSPQNPHSWSHHRTFISTVAKKSFYNDWYTVQWLEPSLLNFFWRHSLTDWVLIGEILGYHCHKHEDGFLLGCCAMQLSTNRQTFHISAYCSHHPTSRKRRSISNRVHGAIYQKTDAFRDFDKLTVAQSVKMLLSFYETSGFITVFKTSPAFRILNQMNQIHALPTYLSIMYFNIILQSSLFKLSNNILHCTHL